MENIEQVSIAYSGTLHHQLTYRLQNHALNLPHKAFTRDPFVIASEREYIPTIIQI